MNTIIGNPYKRKLNSKGNVNFLFSLFFFFLCEEIQGGEANNIFFIIFVTGVLNNTETGIS